MSMTVNLDWKAFAAIGGSVVAAIFVSKLDKPAVVQVANHTVDACKEVAVAYTTVKTANPCLPSGGAQ